MDMHMYTSENRTNFGHVCKCAHMQTNVHKCVHVNGALITAIRSHIIIKATKIYKQNIMASITLPADKNIAIILRLLRD